MKTPLERAIDACRTQVALAEEVARRTRKPIRQGHVWKWLRSTKGAPAEYCIAIEEATIERGQPVSRYELRPDVFGPPPFSSPGLEAE